ncbi:MAG: integrase [Chlamydiae bacterium CG10_big_fil_rev_8_21_14_0_10_42_34]|nr:MAG: integrase [Chlamydiae bacterium CG10_big_fil_rev_8_21_14_0_10_42_34]
MASVYRRKNANGTTVWRAVIRIKGYPSISNHFERKQEADDWANETERRIKLGQFNFSAHNKHHTYADLLHRMEGDGAFDLQRSFRNCRSQFDYWKQRLGVYALIHITPELIAQERKTLIDAILPDGAKRSPATINRYTAVLSATFGYAVKKLRWITENPCRTLSKLKENSGRDRILNDEEITRLLAACKESKTSLPYPIVLFALTTGARRGEILGLEWKHIDLEKGIAFLTETKNGRPRSVALSDPVIVELKMLFEARNSLKPLVFASKTAFGRIDIKKSWMQAVKRSDLTDYHFHDLRHQFATFAAGQGASNVELATAMGHRTLSMLLRYSNLDAKNSKKFSDHISERILKGSTYE